MKPRAAVIVAAVLAAFLLGTTGTASAGGALTKGTVKKIAAAVVKKAAPTLSVAHATTAGSATSAATAANAANAANADKLDGLDSSDLKTAVFSFTFPAGLGGLSHVYGLPGLPAGTYAASYDVTTNSPGSTTCEIVPSLATAPSTAVGRAYSVPSGTTSSVSGSAAFATGSQPAFRCTSTAGPFDLTGGSITLTRVDTLVTGVASPFA